MLARQVGDSASSPANSMADSNNSNMLESTTIVFGSWACTANGSGGYTSYLIALEEPRTTNDEQLAELREKPSTRVPSTLNSGSVGNVPAPTSHGESDEPGVVPDSENFQFSETLRKYVAYLKSLKHPRVSNSELLDGVDQVS